MGEVDVYAEPPNILQHRPAEITCRVPVKRGIRVQFDWKNFPFGMMGNGKVNALVIEMLSLLKESVYILKDFDFDFSAIISACNLCTFTLH